MRSYVARAWVPAILLSLSAGPAGAHSGAAGRAQCAAVAPGVTTCSSGLHNGFWTYDLGVPDQPLTTHGVLLYGNYTGSIESRLEWPAVNPTQHRSFRCPIRDGEVVGECASNGTYPPPTVHFQHTCHSYATGSPTQHGGSGNWGCYVDHDASPVTIPPPGPADRPSLPTPL